MECVSIFRCICDSECFHFIPLKASFQMFLFIVAIDMTTKRGTIAYFCNKGQAKSEHGLSINL